MRRAVERLSSNDRPSHFFIEAATPTLGGSPARLERAVTMDDAFIDFLDAPTTDIKLTLDVKRLVFYVATTIAFYSVFTVVAFIGIPVETIYEPIGTSKKAEDRVEFFNTYSGYVMSFIETLVGMYTAYFMPVVTVYVHNALYFLQRASTTQNTRTGDRKERSPSKVSAHAHRAILFGLPIVLALTMGNSLRSFQAGQSSDGFKRIMSADDLTKDSPTLQRVQPNQTNATTGRSVRDTILLNAIRQESMPFAFYTKSHCGGVDNATSATNKTQRTVQLNVHELDSTSAVFGFVPQEWNGEAIPFALAPITSVHLTYKQADDAANANKTLPWTAGFSLATAYEILTQGKLVIERAQGDAATDTYPCSLSDGRSDKLSKNATAGNSTNVPPMALTKSVFTHVTMGTRRRRLAEGSTSAPPATGSGGLGDDEDAGIDDSLNGWTTDEDGVRQCQGAVSSLFDFDDPDLHTTEVFVLATAAIFNKTLGNLSLAETEITLETYNLTSQIQVDAVRIDIPIDTDMSYGLNSPCHANQSEKCDPMYWYGGLGESFCGSDGCAFLDDSNTMKMQREIGIVPYVVNCTLDADHVHYSADFRGYYPSDCAKVPNTALLYGIGSYITGDEYGSNDTTHGTDGPYVVAPRRHLRFTFAKVTWRTEDLAKEFGAHCGNGNDKTDCHGLWYRLEASGRFLFAGNEALPSKQLAAADFRSPISLVQLNTPTLYVPKLDDKVRLETLTRSNFQRVKWDKKPLTTKAGNGTNVATAAALHGDQCSMLIDSYLRQVSNNNYVIEQPLQVMYTSFFYYLMQNAAVTELNDTKLAAGNGTNKSVTALALSKNDKLGNVKLKGDMQVRSIRVSIPKSSFQTTLAGCIFIVVAMIVVVLVPARRVQYFEEGTSMALQYLAMNSEEAYPESVHTKTLEFPVTNEVVSFHELEIERMVLVHESERDKKVYL